MCSGWIIRRDSVDLCGRNIGFIRFLIKWEAVEVKKVLAWYHPK